MQHKNHTYYTHTHSYLKNIPVTGINLICQNKNLFLSAVLNKKGSTYESLLHLGRKLMFTNRDRSL